MSVLVGYMPGYKVLTKTINHQCMTTWYGHNSQFVSHMLPI